MNRKLFAAASLTTLLLTGCGTASRSASSPDVTPIPTRAAAPSSPAAEPKTSDRGNLIKNIGQPAGMADANGDQSVNFAVTDIKKNLKCNTGYPAKADNGHLIAVKMDVEVKKNFADPDYPGETFPTHSSAWKFISANGTTFNGDLGTDGAFNCLDDKQTLPSEGIGPAQKASGWIVLDVPAKTGTLIFDYYGTGGWEWELTDNKPNA